MGLELGEIRYIVQSVPCGSGSTVQLRSEGVGRSQTRSLYACLFCDGCRCPSWSTIVSLEMRFAVSGCAFQTATREKSQGKLRAFLFKSAVSPGFLPKQPLRGGGSGNRASLPD